MFREEGQAGGRLRDAVELRDLARRALLERELRARQEEVVHEVRAGLAELGQVGEDGLVRLDQVAIGATPARSAEAAAAEALILLLLRLQRDGQVGADAGERVERLVLRTVEPLRQARDRDDEGHTEPEADDGDDGARPPADQLVAEIPQVEHRSPIEHRVPQRSIRTNLRRFRETVAGRLSPPRAHQQRYGRLGARP